MLRSLTMPGLAALGSLAVLSAASAQDVGLHTRSRARSVHTVTAAPVKTPSYRGLTINRPPEAALPDDDIYQDGPVRYNDVRDFSPSPYTTSGVQFPFGLDGVGGYGSDFDVGAGQDAALYNRGANGRP